jgi:hypothetical protein
MPLIYARRHEEAKKIAAEAAALAAQKEKV